jgi:hypothetical protein
MYWTNSLSEVDSLNPGRPIIPSFWRGERFWARKRVESYGRCLEPAKVAAGRAVGEALGYVT